MSDALRVQLKQLLSASEAEQAGTVAVGSTSVRESGATRSREQQSLHLEQLAALVKSAVETETTEDLGDVLHELEQQRESEIQAICDNSDNPLIASLDQLALVNSRARELRKSISVIARQNERGSTQLIDTVTHQVEKTRTRANIESSLSIVNLLLQALEHTNQVEAQLRSGHRATAVQNLQDLQSMELDELKHIGMGMLISQAVKFLSKDITRATSSGIDTYLSSANFQAHLEEIGLRSYDLIAKQKQSWDSIVQGHRHLKNFRLNSPVELAYRRSKENYLTLSQLGVDLGPLYEAEMVFRKLGIEGSLVLNVESRLSSLSDAFVISDPGKLLASLPSLVGLCLFDRTLSVYLPSVRPAKMVDDNWEKLAQNISRVIGHSLHRETDFSALKTELGRVVNILQNFQFNVAIITDIFRTLLQKVTAQVLEAAKAEFDQRWGSGDQMQMVVTTPADYEQVVEDVWYRPDEYQDHKVAHGEVQLPKAFPFSEIYQLMCRRLRALMASGSSFLDFLQQDPGFVENTVARAVDSLLIDTVARNLEDVARGHNRELIVQSMINLQLFSQASSEIEQRLSKMRETTGRRGAVALDAKPILTRAVATMETRIYVLLEETVHGFFDSATFDWQTEEALGAPSSTVLEMTTYLLTLANTILKRLPPHVRSLAHFNLTENVGSGMRDSLYSAPAGITATALDNFDTDLRFLEDSISQITDQASPSDALVEIRQMIDLLRSPDPTAEFNDPKIRNRKYGQISVPHAYQLIRKIKPAESAPQSPDPGATSPRAPQSGFMRYLSGEKN